MRIGSATFAVTAALLLGSPAEGMVQRPADARARDAMETRIWLDRGADPVLQGGDRVRVYYRASRDAFVALFHLNTDGVLRLLFPAGLDEPLKVRAGQDYRLLFQNSTDWEVAEAPGVGYFFALASESPLDFAGVDIPARTEEWATLARVGAPVREDPYVILDGVTTALAPDRTRGSMAVDLAAYHVGQAYSYPRFLCYNCHTAEPFERWNPYQQACLSYRVIIYNDPYFYAATRYQGSRALYPLPPNPGQSQFAFKARVPGESGAPLVHARTGPTDAAAALLIPRGTTSAGPQPPLGVFSPPSSVLPGASPAAGDPLGTGPETPQGRPTLERRSRGSPDSPPR
ncbi:MAG: DUF4384 domain-containing protein [Gemmatimonadota bacterium]